MNSNPPLRLWRLESWWHTLSLNRRGGAARERVGRQMRWWAAWLWLGLVLFSSSTAIAAQGFDKDAETKCRSEDDPVVVITNCTNVIQHTKDKIALERIYNSRGRANMKVEDFTSAVSDFSKVIELNPKIAGYYDNRQNAFKGLGDLKSALADASMAVKLAPTYAFVYNGRANVYLEMKNYELAIADFTRAIDVDANSAGLYIGRGDSYFRNGHVEEAIKDYTTAYELYEDSSLSGQNTALRQRGLAYIAVEKFDLAISDLQDALRFIDDDEEAENALRLAISKSNIAGQTASQLGKNVEVGCREESDPTLAISYCDKLLNSTSDVTILENVYNWRGLANMRLKYYEQAVTDFSHAIAISPGNAGSYINRKNAFLGLGNVATALEDANKAVELAPNYAIMLTERADIYMKMNKYNSAIIDLTKAISLAPKDAELLMSRGDAFIKNGDVELAIKDFGDSYNMSWKISALRGRGLANVLAKNFVQGVSDLREAINSFPNDMEVKNGLSLAQDALRIKSNLSEFEENHPITIVNEATRPALHCTLEDGVSRCRPASGEFVWCASMETLDAIEHGTVTDSYFQSNILIKEIESKHCGVTRYVDLYFPQRTAEGVENPQISKKLFASLGVKGTYDLADKPTPPVAAASGSVSAPVAPAAKNEFFRPEPSVQSLPIARSPDPAPREVVSSLKEKRIALVIGNSNYRNAPVLKNPALDAVSVSEQLEHNGIVVTSLYDLTREQLVQALAKFSNEAETADWAMIYYAGHGIEIAGVNYLIPIDAQLATDRSVKFEAIPLTQAIDATDGARKLKLIVLDACRANPFANRMQVATSSRAPTRGLARPPEYDPGTYIVYAAREGEVASDGIDGGHSPFAAAFLKELQTPGVEIRRFFDIVGDDVINATGGNQHPFTYGRLPGRVDFYLNAAK